MQVKRFSEYSLGVLAATYGPTFRTITMQGYLIRESEQTAVHPEYNHYFCGPHDVPGAVCPNCRKPFVRILAIDTRDPRLGLSYCPFPTLSLFFCMTCEISQDVLSYQVQGPDGRIQLLHYREGNCEPDNIPFYPQPYPRYFPGVPVELIPLSQEQQWYILEGEKLAYERASVSYEEDEKREELQKKEELFHAQYHQYHPSGSQSAHQIGGFPELAQEWECETAEGWEGHLCPICRQEMAYLAAFYDQSTDPRGFIGNGAAQFLFTWCSKCFVVEEFCQE